LSSTDTPTDDAQTEEEAAPVDHARDDLVARLTDHLGAGLIESHLVPGDDLCVRVARDSWVEAAEFSRKGLGFAYFSFLSGIDWMPSPFGRDMDAQVDLQLEADEADHSGTDEGSATDSDDATDTFESGVAGGDTRFQVFARVNDVVNGLGITFKVDVPTSDLSVASWVEVYPGANWHERECWEMFGITFTGHPGLRHLYLPGEFEGNPLRKDYPLLARRMKPWPGIVDVEQMPDDETPAADPAQPVDSNEGGDASESSGGEA